MSSNLSDDLHAGALVYHRLPRPGKLEIQATKPLGNQRDLALAYSPGVAAACMAIAADPATAAELTTRANLVAVVTNGTAVLGLGNIGPLAGKAGDGGQGRPVQKIRRHRRVRHRGRATIPIELVDIVAALEPTFGGINLEDIKAPECFEIEAKLRERMKIPVFHDDQHGTAIIVAAAVRNALELAGKRIEEVKAVASGAGAAALACLNLLVAFGLQAREHFCHRLRWRRLRGPATAMDRWQGRLCAQDRQANPGRGDRWAPIFSLACRPAVFSSRTWSSKWRQRPLILALANPDPEIDPAAALAVRPDAMICTGRSDYPNQVNNVLCFPFIFRGALDVGATPSTRR